MTMRLGFVNREVELRELNAAEKRGGLIVLYGRRRIGKTRLLSHWLKNRPGLYSQAIEAPADLQLQQIFSDISENLETNITPKTLAELLEILTLQKRKWVLCLDEFPYLTATNPSLASQIQKFIDHSMPDGCLLILCGSSIRMMHDLFLNRTAPLYGRAEKLINLRPMNYGAFCKACKQKPTDPESFEKFSLVGGIPKYWEFVEKDQSATELANALYFDYAPYMEQEPQRILRDEGVTGLNAVAVLEAIGRGAERPSEIAARMGTVHSNLTRLFQMLIDTSVLIRELPFGESARSTKRVLYRIQDPTIRFWFRVYSPHRSLWHTYSTAEKQKLIHQHASTVFEDYCRSRYPGSSRYWDATVELDLIYPSQNNPKHLVIAEINWKRLTDSEKNGVLRNLEERWIKSKLSSRYSQVRFEVLDMSSLNQI